MLYLYCVNTPNALYLDTRKKPQQPQKERGIAFEDAKRVFEGLTVERIDDRFDYGEVRVYAIGLVNGIEITVIYADRGDDERRIISAWKAEPHERRYYWKKIEGG